MAYDNTLPAGGRGNFAAQSVAELEGVEQNTSAAVQELTPTTYFTSKYLDNIFSKYLTWLPVVSHPSWMESEKIKLKSDGTLGLWNGILIILH